VFTIGILKKIRLHMDFCYRAIRPRARFVRLAVWLRTTRAGEKTLVYGKTERYVRQIKMVIHDGSECTFAPLPPAELKLKMAQQDAEGDIYRKM